MSSPPTSTHPSLTSSNFRPTIRSHTPRRYRIAPFSKPPLPDRFTTPPGKHQAAAPSDDVVHRSSLVLAHIHPVSVPSLWASLRGLLRITRNSPANSSPYSGLPSTVAGLHAIPNSLWCLQPFSTAHRTLDIGLEAAISPPAPHFKLGALRRPPPSSARSTAPSHYSRSRSLVRVPPSPYLADAAVTDCHVASDCDTPQILVKPPLALSSTPSNCLPRPPIPTSIRLGNSTGP